jgi:hypothetical protein
LWRACCGPDESTEGLLFPLQSVPRALLGNGHSIMPRQCFLRGQFPGYIESWSLSLELSVGSYQDSVGKGCHKRSSSSGTLRRRASELSWVCGRSWALASEDSAVILCKNCLKIYSVVNVYTVTESNKSNCQSNTRL